MTQGNEFGAAFGRLNAGDARHRKYITFLVIPRLDQLKSVGQHAYDGLGYRLALGRCLRRHIYHVRGAGFIQMGQLSHTNSCSLAERLHYTSLFMILGESYV